MPVTGPKPGDTAAGRHQMLDEPASALDGLSGAELDVYVGQLTRAVAHFERTRAPVAAFIRDRLTRAKAERELRSGGGDAAPDAGPAA